MKIKNVEVNFDFLDADDMERFENEARRVKSECEKQQTQSMLYSEVIRRECTIIDSFFNNVFGEGTSQKIFNGKMNLMEHINVFQDIVNEKIRAQEDMKNTLNRYMPNREQRRHKQR